MTLKQLMELVDEYGRACSDNREWNNEHTVKATREAVKEALRALLKEKGK